MNLRTQIVRAIVFEQYPLLCYLAKPVIFFVVFQLKEKKISFNWRDQSLFITLCMPLFLFLITSIILSGSSLAGWYGLGKLIEFLFVGRYVSIRFKTISQFWFSHLLQAELIWVSALAIWQFAIQHSVGGLFYFLGERTFYPSTPGIATISFHGQQLVRPYATFPHPNVLAFFLIFGLIFVLFSKFPHQKLQQIVYVLALSLGTIALLLTFSRVIIVCFCVFIAWFLSFRFQSIRKILLPLYGGVALIFFVFFFSNRFGESSLLRDFTFRSDLAAISFSLISKYPIFGVGLNNFFAYELFYQKTISPILLQPAHNIYLFIASETGIVGLGIFIVFLMQTFKNVKKRILTYPMFMPAIIIYFIVLFSGLFDHYFITLQQGQLLTSFLFGLCWIKQEIKVEKFQLRKSFAGQAKIKFKIKPKKL